MASSTKMVSVIRPKCTGIGNFTGTLVSLKPMNSRFHIVNFVLIQNLIISDSQRL